MVFILDDWIEYIIASFIGGWLYRWWFLANPTYDVNNRVVNQENVLKSKAIQLTNERIELALS